MLKKSIRFFKDAIKAALPRGFIRLIVFARGLRFKVISYSQYGEDLIVNNYFSKKNIFKGVYLDIGAFHPVWLSNTHLLHKKGWSGHVIDVDSAKIKAFNFVCGRNVKTHYMAVTATPTKSVDLYKFNKPWSEVDTLSFEAAENWKKHGESYTITTVPAISINELLNLVGKINFLNIDVEGLDETILLSMNFDSNAPEVIVFEDNQNWGGSDKVTEKLKHFGYQHLFTSNGSVGYCQPL